MKITCCQKYRPRTGKKGHRRLLVACRRSSIRNSFSFTPFTPWKCLNYAECHLQLSLGAERNKVTHSTPCHYHRRHRLSPPDLSTRVPLKIRLSLWRFVAEWTVKWVLELMAAETANPEIEVDVSWEKRPVTTRSYRETLDGRRSSSRSNLLSQNNNKLLLRDR